MAWVVKGGYSPGQRHKAASELRLRPPVFYAKGHDGQDRFTQVEEVDLLCGGALCAERYGVSAEGAKLLYGHGGLSFVDAVSLLQANVCTRCKKLVIASRPDLAAAVELLKGVA
jgi:hypothetical protein